MPRLFERKEGFANFAASSQSRIELSRNYHMQHLMVKLTVTHNNAANAVFKDSDVFALINNIEIVANGNQNLKQIPFSKLYLNNIFATGKEGMNSIVTAEGDGKESYVYAVIPFSMAGMIRPHDTILNTRAFSTFEMLINWGSDSTIGTNITVTGAKLEVFSSSLIGYSRNKGETIKYFKETALVKEVTSSTNEMEIQLPVNKVYKTISVISLVDGQRVNTVINNIRIKSGNTVFLDLPAEAIRAKNIFEFAPDSEDKLNGIHIIDFAGRSRLSDCLNTLAGQGYNTLEVVLDVSKQEGTNNVYIVSDTVEDTNIPEVK